MAAWIVPARAEQVCFTRICKATTRSRSRFRFWRVRRPAPLTGVAMTNFDGQGYLSQVDHVVRNGAPPALAWRPGTGSYTVNLDCTGTAVINFTNGSPPLQLYFVLTKLGAEIRIVVNNAGTNTTSVGVRRN